MRSTIALLCALTPLVPQAHSPAAPADPIVTNARIYTVDDTRPVAGALAVRGGRVLFVGSMRGALATRGPQTRVVDAAGATVTPGIADAHVHLLSLGMALRSVDLDGT